MLLSAKQIVEDKVIELRERVNKLKKKPKLVIIKVGDDLASERYVNNKINLCEKVGIESDVVYIGKKTTNKNVAYTIDILNKDEDVTGILLQLPLPKQLDAHYLMNLIDPEKDVDGFTEVNIGKLVQGKQCNIACTPKGIIDLLKHYNIPIKGKDVLIINRSNIVGKPLAHLFLEEDATVTIAHSKTNLLKSKIWTADIIVSGVGKTNFLTKYNFKPGATIVDVSINVNDEGKLCGDVCKNDYNDLVSMGCNITPVPGGVGPMTVLSLIEQTIKIAEDK